MSIFQHSKAEVKLSPSASLTLVWSCFVRTMVGDARGDLSGLGGGIGDLRLMYGRLRRHPGVGELLHVVENFLNGAASLWRWLTVGRWH